MPINDSALTSASPAEQAFLEMARVGRLATVDADSRPHVVPVCFAVVGGRIYSPLDEKPKRVAPRRLQRVRNVAAHPAVCLVVDRYSEQWAELAWLQVRADADVLEPGDPEHAAAVAGLRERYRQYEEMAIDQRPILRLIPRRIVSWGV